MALSHPISMASRGGVLGVGSSHTLPNRDNEIVQIRLLAYYAIQCIAEITYHKPTQWSVGHLRIPREEHEDRVARHFQKQPGRYNCE